MFESYFSLINLILILFSSLAYSKYLNIVDTYKRELEDLPDIQKDAYGILLKSHINMLERIDVPTNFDDNFEDDICKSLFASATNCESPIALFVGGGTASGKSSITETWEPIVNRTCGYVYIDPDAIMMELPEWKKLINSSESECAANDLHDNSSAIAMKCFIDAINNNFTIVYDGTMSNYDKTANQIQLVETHGYEVQMFGVTVDTTIAAERAWNRAIYS